MQILATVRNFFAIVQSRASAAVWSAKLGSGNSRQVIAVLFSLHVATFAANLDPQKFLVFGLGLTQPNFQLPVRWFYVQLVDKDGQNVTVPPVENYLRFEVEGTAAAKASTINRCLVAKQIIDRHDGSFLLRFRLHSTCDELTFYIKTADGVDVAKSPYTLKGNPHLYHDACNCPLPNLPEFYADLNCSTSVADYAQLRIDLETWPPGSVDFSWVVAEVEDRFAKHRYSHSLCHYRIFQNEIYRKCYGEYVGFSMFGDAFLLSLARKVRLPDTEFFLNLGDWPLEKRPANQNPIPIISWCGSEDTRDLIFPTYEITEATLESMGRQSLDIQSVEGMAATPWERKFDTGFFRGRDSRQERLDLVELSRKFPDLIDAGLTRFFFFRDQLDRYGPEVPYVTFGDFFKFKYQISVDGTVAAYRFPFLLAGNSAVLKQESPYYEHFYAGLKPWVHFVPFVRDLTDLFDKLRWIKKHDADAAKIAANGKNFVRENLQPNKIFCYHVKVLEEYTKLLKQPPKDLPSKEFEHVKQPEQNCVCHRNLKKTEKDEL